MPDPRYQPGQSFPLQFAWRLPDGDYLRAVFRAEVLELVPAADKYVIRLGQLIAGREDDAEGKVKPLGVLKGEQWELVRGLVGRAITIAYEADDGRPLYLRLATLTGEHNFFSRYEDAAVIARGVEARMKRLQETEWYADDTDHTDERG